MMELVYDSDQDAVHGVSPAQMWRDETDYHLNIPRYESRWQARESSQYPTFEGQGTQKFPSVSNSAAVIHYPPYQGQGTQHNVFRMDRFYRNSESWGNHQRPWNNDDPLIMMKQCWPDSCPAAAQRMRNDDQDFCTLNVSQSRSDSRVHPQEGYGSHGDEGANGLKVREHHFSESPELRLESLDELWDRLMQWCRRDEEIQRGENKVKGGTDLDRTYPNEALKDEKIGNGFLVGPRKEVLHRNASGKEELRGLNASVEAVDVDTRNLTGRVVDEDDGEGRNHEFADLNLGVESLRRIQTSATRGERTPMMINMSNI